MQQSWFYDKHSLENVNYCELLNSFACYEAITFVYYWLAFLLKPEVGDVFNKLQKKCAVPGLEN